MDFLTQLWIPILVAAAASWVYSAVAWMVLPHHRKDHVGLPNEDGFLAALRGLNIPPGVYGFPYCKSHSAGKDPAFMEKWKTGPSGMLNVWKPQMNMGLNMFKTFVVYLIACTLMAYLSWAAMGGQLVTFAKVMQVVGTAGILAYTIASLPNAIWFQASRNAMISCLIDGVIQGLITGAVFGWLWPSARLVGSLGA